MRILLLLSLLCLVCLRRASLDGNVDQSMTDDDKSTKEFFVELQSDPRASQDEDEIYGQQNLRDDEDAREDIFLELQQLKLEDDKAVHTPISVRASRWLGTFVTVFKIIRGLTAGNKDPSYEILKELREIKQMLSALSINLDQLSTEVNKILRIITQNHHVRTLATLFGKDILRLRLFMHFLKNPGNYDNDNQIRITEDSIEWARAVLSKGDDGIEQILFNIHCMVTGCLTSILPIRDAYMKGLLNPYRSDIWHRMDQLLVTINEMQKAGYSSWAIALDIMGRSEEKLTKIEALLNIRLFNQKGFLLIRPRLKKWPAGTYGLVKAATGCPTGLWGEGKRYHDTEDKNAYNHGTPNLDMYIPGFFPKDDMAWKFCIRYQSSGTFQWPKGQYCLFAYSDCPSGFSRGYLFFDDENTNNRNRHSGYMPSGSYGSDTKYEFCCRTDGSINTPINLPIERPFVLFPLHQNGCQKVYRMKIKSLYFYWNCEATNNKNIRHYPYPTETNQGRNMNIHMCHYSAN